MPKSAKVFLFDVTLTGAIRVAAHSEKEARELLAECLDCADANLGAWPNGQPILAEVSLSEDPILAEDEEDE